MPLRALADTSSLSFNSYGAMNVRISDPIVVYMERPRLERVCYDSDE